MIAWLYSDVSWLGRMRLLRKLRDLGETRSEARS
jgi:hypothetical protein